MRNRVAWVAALALPVFALAGRISSGLKPGEFVSAFEPHHVTGPDRGTDTCPVCKYGATPAVQVWVNQDNWGNVAKIATDLEGQISKNGSKNLKAFVVYVKPSSVKASQVKTDFENIAVANKLSQVALTFVDGPSDAAVGEYKINTDSSIKNTVLVYSNRAVVKNFVNLKADESGLAGLNAAVKQAVAAKH